MRVIELRFLERSMSVGMFLHDTSAGRGLFDGRGLVPKAWPKDVFYYVRRDQSFKRPASRTLLEDIQSSPNESTIRQV